MPLSKKRNRDRMRIIRLHKQLSSSDGANHGQPKPPEPSVEDILIARDYLDNADVPTEGRMIEPLYIDADGNMVYE